MAWLMSSTPATAIYIYSAVSAVQRVLPSNSSKTIFFPDQLQWQTFSDCNSNTQHFHAFLPTGHKQGREMFPLIWKPKKGGAMVKKGSLGGGLVCLLTY